MGVPAKNFPKVAYLVNSVFFMGISVILLYCLRFSADEWDWFQCIETTEDDGVTTSSSSCYGIKAVLGMSFTLFIFHLLVLIFISPRVVCSSMAHDSFWGAKFLFIIVLYIGCFFIPHNFYIAWAHICRGGSLLFYVVQGYFLLNASYSLNDKLLVAADSRDPKEATCSKVFMLVASIIITIGNAVWLGFQFYWSGTCGISLIVVSSTTAFVIFFYVAALVKLCNVEVFRKNATIFTVSVASVYIVYMSWSATASITDSVGCEVNFDAETNTGL